MDLSKAFGAAKSGAKKAKTVVQKAGDGDKDLLETMEAEDTGLDVIDSGTGMGPDAESEDMIGNLERDMDDGAFDIELEDFD